MNAKSTRTKSQALLALSVVVASAAWPGVSLAADRRTEQAEERAYAVVRRNVSGLQSCYIRSGQAGGAKLQISFEVGPRGRATDIRVHAPGVQGDSLPACVSAAVARWPFPPSVRTRVSFPLLFVQG